MINHVQGAKASKVKPCAHTGKQLQGKVKAWYPHFMIQIEIKPDCILEI